MADLLNHTASWLTRIAAWLEERRSARLVRANLQRPYRIHA